MVSDRGYYLLVFPDGCVYVGASFGLRKRLGRHIWLLERSRHPNRNLQAAWGCCRGEGVKQVMKELPVETVEEMCIIEQVMIRFYVETRGRARVLNRSLRSAPRSFAAFARRQKQSAPSVPVIRVGRKGHG